MTDPHGNPNLLTAAADDKWKAIRKGVAVSFAFQNIKKKYPMVLGRVNRVITRAAALGPEASIDVDQLALRVTLDVIGLAGFGHDYQSVEKDKPEYEHLLVRAPACMALALLCTRWLAAAGLAQQYHAAGAARMAAWVLSVSVQQQHAQACSRRAASAAHAAPHAAPPPMQPCLTAVAPPPWWFLRRSASCRAASLR